MKKLVLSVAAIIGLSVAGAMAQLNVTFRVDMTDYINNGGAVSPNGVSIAGSFAGHGSTTLIDWSPSTGAMTDIGNNVWSIDVPFDGTAADSLNWKYVNGNDWTDDEGNEWVILDATCIRPTDNNNRKALLPATGNWMYSSKWAECGALVVNTSTLELVNGLDVKMGPNPTNSTLNIRFAGSSQSVIRMTGLDGKVVKTIKVGQNGTSDFSVNVSDLSSGLYFVSVVDGNRTFKAPVVVAK